MATHPLPPEDFPELVEAYAQTAQAVLDLALTCRESDFAESTQCPGWTVHDQLAHVGAFEAAMAGDEDAPVEVPDHPWIRSEVGRSIEHGVEVRRSWTDDEVVAELERVIPFRLATLRDEGLDEDTELSTPFGPRPAGKVVPQRAMDVWCHEQDVRDAVGRPGNLDSPAAALFTVRVLDAFRVRTAAQSGLDVGTAVILESTGPVTGREGVRIVQGEDGLDTEPLFSGTATEGHEHESITTVRLSTHALTRRGAGRISVDDLHFTVEGDEEVARKVLEHLVITP